tara:strand:+ start:2740 stop:4113 length:1374 start_codon:yes stop_codon:yes gene_type:complete
VIDAEDTIAAIASPNSPAVRGMIRLSGDRVADVLSRLSLSPADSGTSRPVRYDAVLDVGAPLGEIPVSVMFWPTRRSYTGQPSVELHTFGSPPILDACLDATIGAGARVARPGEFTMRAFLAGRLDLTQAEAVLGVIDAENRGSLDYALRQLAGNLSKPLEQLRDSMLNLLADVEAGLDFVDEDIEFVSDEVLVERLTDISRQVQQTIETMQSRGGGGDKPVVVLRGLPNAGKSRLINCLAGRDAAIVASVAGTTRDVVSIDTMIGDQEVRMVDTAGIEDCDDRDPAGNISAQSQQQAARAGAESDVRLWCVDASRHEFDRSDSAMTDAVRRSTANLWVATKSDLVDESDIPADWIATSAVTGQGIDDLVRAIANALAKHDTSEIGSVTGTAARCRDTLSDAVGAIERAIRLTQSGDGHEFVASELRAATQCLGEVTGAVYTDDILDRVFSRFCIGK